MAAGALLVLVALLGAPLFTVIGAGALLGFHREGVDLSVVAIEFFRLSETPVLVAIPLFTFAGFCLAPAALRTDSCGFASAARLAAGRSRDRHARPCALFTAFTGASGVTIIALGALLYPGA